MERIMHSVKLRDGAPNTVFRERIKITDILSRITNIIRKCADQITRLHGSRWIKFLFQWRSWREKGSGGRPPTRTDDIKTLTTK